MPATRGTPEYEFIRPDSDSVHFIRTIRCEFKNRAHFSARNYGIFVFPGISFFLFSMKSSGVNLDKHSREI